MESAFWCEIERFQTLISGVLAVIAAICTAVVVYRSARYPVEEANQKQVQQRNKELRIAKLELRSWLSRAKIKVRKVSATLRVYHHSQEIISEELRDTLLFPYPKIMDDRALFSEFEGETIFNVIEMVTRMEMHNDSLRSTRTVSVEAVHREFQNRLNLIEAFVQRAFSSL